MIQSILDQAIWVSFAPFRHLDNAFRQQLPGQRGVGALTSALPAAFAFSHAASNAAPKSSVVSLSKAAFASSATIRITGSFVASIVQSPGGKISVCTPSHCVQT